MKRNHTNHREPKSGLSSYRRHGKKPYVYSQGLRQWERDNGRREQAEVNRSRSLTTGAERRTVATH
jgi:hypothetical protein